MAEAPIPALGPCGAARRAAGSTGVIGVDGSDVEEKEAAREVKETGTCAYLDRALTTPELNTWLD